MWKILIISVFLMNSYEILGLGKHCGKPIDTLYHETKIVGGYDVGFYKYPWYAALIHKKSVECGGALINSKDILTAAHCFDGTKSKSTSLEGYFVVKLGVYNVCKSESTQDEFKIEKVKIHELYEKTNPYNDIALITLTKSVDDKFVPICLPKNFIKRRPKEGFVPGLGTLTYHGATPCTLHEARLLIYPDQNCEAILKNVEKNISVLEKAFCAGYIQGGTDTCQGDSGGPFQILESKGIYRLLGIVSFGYKCADPGLLGIYTDVSQHLDWIKKHISEVNEEFTDSPDEITEHPVHQTMEAVSVPLPSILGKPSQQFLKFYPVRPSIRIQLSPINILINTKKLSKTKSKGKKKFEDFD